MTFHAIRFRDDAIIEPGIKVGVMIAIEYYNNCFSMARLNWGPEMKWECPFDGAVEQHWLFNEETTKQLMLKTGARNGIELLNAMYDRFKKRARNANYHIEKWCKQQGFDYYFYYHRETTDRMMELLHEMRGNASISPLFSIEFNEINF